MMRYRVILFYGVVFLLFLLTPTLINYLRFSDKYIVLNEVMRLENIDLKEEVRELSKIDYSDYDYYLAKLSIRNLYGSEVYFLKTNEDLKEGLCVVNQYGLIGIMAKDNIMVGIKNIDLSIRVNNEVGRMEKGILKINSNIKVGDLVYTSGLTNIPKDILVGKVIEVNSNNNGFEAKVELNNIDTNYVAVLKEG